MKLQRTDAAVIGASLLFGINYSSMKLVLIFFPPFVAALLRFGIAGIVIFFLLRRLEGSIRISRQTLQRLLVSGVVGYGIQQILFLYGFKFVDASLGALLSAFTNALMTVIASIVAHERLTKWMLGGVLIACLGMVCCAWQRRIIGLYSSDLDWMCSGHWLQHHWRVYAYYQQAAISAAFAAAGNGLEYSYWLALFPAVGFI